MCQVEFGNTYARDGSGVQALVTMPVRCVVRGSRVPAELLQDPPVDTEGVIVALAQQQSQRKKRPVARGLAP